MYKPSEQVFAFDVVFKPKQGASYKEVHLFSWPAEEEGQLKLASILSDPKKNPRKKLSNINAVTRHQDGVDENGQDIPALRVLSLPDEILLSETHMTQNKVMDSVGGREAEWQYYPNGAIKSQRRKNAKGVNVNGANGEPACVEHYENGQMKEKHYRVQPDARKWHTIPVNGPNDEPANQKWSENGVCIFEEYCDYDDAGKTINRPDGTPTCITRNEQGNVIEQSYAEPKNGPRGFKSIGFNAEGTINKFVYYSDKGTYLEVTDPLQLAVLGADKDDGNKIKVSQQFIAEKAKITFLSAPKAQKALPQGNAIKQLSIQNQPNIT